jgi:hypothetical protein
VKVDATVTAGVLVVPQVAMSSEEWQRAYQDEMLRSNAHEQAQQGPVTIEGEAHEVKRG